MSNEKEYVLTVKQGVDWQEIHQELSRDTSTDSKVDSNIVPDRTVDTRKLRRQNKRNTHYNLTDLEAEKLRKDPRIEAVQLIDIVNSVKLLAQQNGPFKRSPTNTSNYGFLRHTNKSSIPSLNVETETNSPYNYVLDGTGVDVVIQDTGIQASHPQFNDSEGNSRVQQIDWAQYDSDSHSNSGSPYQDPHGHGTHVAGTVAGLTTGWAKNAQIYSQNVLAGMSIANGMDALLGWHKSKNGSRPTVVNMSYGNIMQLADYPQGQGMLGFPGQTINNGGIFRGSNISSTQLSFWFGRGINGTEQFTQDHTGAPVGYYDLGNRVPANDADVQQCLDEGIIMIKAAGNDSVKIDTPSGIDYNNKLNFTGGAVGGVTEYYYNRGSSPLTDTGDDICVGSLSASGRAGQEKKADFSNAGPRVDIYAVGDNVYSSWIGNTYRNIDGTSMASPQVAGIAALVLQAHPDWTPKQLKSYLINNASLNELYEPAITDDSIQHFTSELRNTIYSGPNRIAFLPMNGASPFGYSSS